jgi:hypothetical protein
MHKLRSRGQYLPLTLFLTILFFATFSFAQQTIFNVPSADVLERGKVYGEVDATHQASSDISAAVPRVVFGLGHRLEAGVNLNQFSTSSDATLSLVPAIKWKLYDNAAKGWSIFAGDNLFLPIHNRTYHVGNYVYAEIAKQFKNGTRIGFGSFEFSRNVVAPAQRAGAQFSIESPVSKKLTLAADWYSGNHANGYFTPGIIFKASSKLTLYGAYEIGNSQLTQGNHLALVELGYNFN